MTQMKLPEGFVLESAPNATPALPEGFVLEEQPAAPQVEPWDVRDPLTGVPGGVRSASPVTPKTPVNPISPGSSGVLDYIDNTGAVYLNGARKGIAQMLSLPGLAVDAVNNAPRLTNLLPGVNGVGPITDTPFGGSQQIGEVTDAIMRAPAEGAASLYNTASEALGSDSRVTADRKPEDLLQNIAYRAGIETGATAVPVAGVFGKAGNMTVEAARQMATRPTTAVEAVVGPMVHSAKVNPARLAGAEATMATGAGMGAGISNNIFSNGVQEGDNFGSDFAGSVAGALATGGVLGLVNAGRGLVAGATGNTRMMDDVARETVADRLIDNSSMMQAQNAAGEVLDTTPLIQQIMRQSPVEQAIPEYRANIGDRTQDVSLMTVAQNADMLNPGAANLRRVGNEQAIDNRLAEMNPGGDPANFRASLQGSVDQQLANAASDADIARIVFEEAQQRVSPQLRDGAARGAAIRTGAADAYERAQANVREMYEPINSSQTEVPLQPLRDRFDEIDRSLPLNDRMRFRPTEADVPSRLGSAPQGPVNTGIVDEYGNAIMRDAAPNADTVPLSEINSVRGGLTDDIRAARADGRAQEARTKGLFQDAVDDYVGEAVPRELQEQLAAARAARRDVADRFERPGTFMNDALRKVEGGGYAMNDAAIGPRVTPTDRGRISDVREVLREAGDNPQVRSAIADEIMADVDARNLLSRPEQLQRYLNERNVLMSEFPELRTQLDAAGLAAQDAANAKRTSETLIRDLTTPGRTATASYLKYADESVGQAIKTVINGPKPVEAVDELLNAVGNAPSAVRDLRTAFWQELSGSAQMRAPGATGSTRWDGKKLLKALTDPKSSAVAERLWKDNPEELADMREVFSALAGSEGSLRTRAPNSSGTAQALNGSYDASLSAASIASRARSVNRGQLSPTIAGVDLLGTWLRRRSAQVQSRAIDQLTAQVVNDPRLAADLLKRYNPADAAAHKRMLTQKYGLRVSQIVNWMDEEAAYQGNGDEDSNAIMRGAN